MIIWPVGGLRTPDWCSFEPVEQYAQLAAGCLSALEEQMIEAIPERCTGIDVGKKFVVVCVMTGGAKDEPHTRIKRFGTIVSELQRLAAWLVAEGCTHAVMESTGSYWKPAFNLLEAHVRVILANAADVQNRRGHRTDPNDSPIFSGTG